MLCVTTISYSILVNGEPKGLFHPSRGIRQGDPISPFIFLLCTEGFHGLISQAAAHGDIRGYSLSRNSPRLTHLFFADDSLLFCRSTIQECQKILEILDTYGRCSGQQINRNKTTIFFSKSTDEDTRNHIKLALGVEEIRQYEKYLVFHLLLGKIKRPALTTLKKEYGGKFKGGKRSSYHKQEGKS